MTPPLFPSFSTHTLVGFPVSRAFLRESAVPRLWPLWKPRTWLAALTISVFRINPAALPCLSQSGRKTMHESPCRAAACSAHVSTPAAPPLTIVAVGCLAAMRATAASTAVRALLGFTKVREPTMAMTGGLTAITTLSATLGRHQGSKCKRQKQPWQPPTSRSPGRS